ncbi:androgen-induced gene 1 protein-like [Clavelina lepadiformis]|uniref:androgen-induced gene 1 protein-like n=1 Tax=Clavelina lepadiformis TaxID=159417 RepID=UPI00404247E4
MVSKLVLSYHAFAWLEATFALVLYHYLILTQIKQTYGRQWKYLTYINLVVQFICFTLCIVKDLTHRWNLKDLSRKIKCVRDVIHASIGIPCALTVLFSFWSIYLIDRELIYPKVLDNILPQWANHVWHSAIILAVGEVLLDHIQYPKRHIGIGICFLFGLVYLVWVQCVYYASGISVYPFLKQLKGLPFALFVTLELIFSWMCYSAGEALSGIGSLKLQQKKVT